MWCRDHSWINFAGPEDLPRRRGHDNGERVVFFAIFVIVLFTGSHIDAPPGSHNLLMLRYSLSS